MDFSSTLSASEDEDVNTLCHFSQLHLDRLNDLVAICADYGISFCLHYSLLRLFDIIIVSLVS